VLRTQTAQFFNGSLRMNLCLFSPYDILSFDRLLKGFVDFGDCRTKAKNGAEASLDDS